MSSLLCFNTVDWWQEGHLASKTLMHLSQPKVVFWNINQGGSGLTQVKFEGHWLKWKVTGGKQLLSNSWVGRPQLKIRPELETEYVIAMWKFSSRTNARGQLTVLLECLV